MDRDDLQETRHAFRGMVEHVTLLDQVMKEAGIGRLMRMQLIAVWWREMIHSCLSPEMPDFAGLLRSMGEAPDDE